MFLFKSIQTGVITIYGFYYLEGKLMNIEISQEIYERLAKHAEGFEQPEKVIEKLLNYFESNSNAAKKKKPEIIFLPDELTFKNELINRKSAWKLFEFQNGEQLLEQWNASRFTEDSNLRANLWSGALRDWQSKCITKLTLSTKKPITANDTGGNVVEIQINKIVKDHINEIISYCETHPEHIEQLSDKGWCVEHFGISFSLIIPATQADDDAELHKRYWVKPHSINNIKYRFCSQFGGKNIVGTKTMSEHHGEKFLHYLKARNILLQEYQSEKIKFIVKS